MKVAIIGTGGVGGYFGGRIARQGHDVTFLARGEHLEAMKRDGLKVKSINGDFTLEKVRATDSIEEIGKVDLVIIGLKAWQIREVAADLKKITGKDTTVLPLQNGVLATEELAEHLDRKHIVGGLCRIISKIESPGVINHFGVEPEIVFGELDNDKTERVCKVSELFESCGIKNKVAFDIHAELWKKFIAICVSGLLAVTRSTYGVVRELKETREMMTGLIMEIFELSKREGIKIKPDFPERTIAFIDTFPYDSTSSLTRDVWEGKPSEIEYQNGTVVRLAEKFGLEVPINKFIYSCILPMEIKARGRR